MLYKPYYLSIGLRDPFISRDSRPFGFGQGNRMHSLDWIRPSVIGGTLRTLLGKKAGGFSSDIVEELEALVVQGPFPLVNDQLYVPAPRDVLFREDSSGNVPHVLRPAPDSEQGLWENTDLDKALRPSFLYPQEEFKPAEAPSFWSMEAMTSWLSSLEGASMETLPFREKWFPRYLESPQKDHRIHAALSPDTGTVEEGHLFATAGLDPLICQRKEGGPEARGGDGEERGKISFYSRDLALRVLVPEGSSLHNMLELLHEVHPSGGERRVAYVKYDAPLKSLWQCPQSLVQNIRKTGKLRMVLATPGVFSSGWLPGWLYKNGDEYEGCPPGSSLELRLLSAVTGRQAALSGWSLKAGQRGPKPVFWAVPSGSVYFFEALNLGKISDKELEKLWFSSVSDDQEKRHDGFGVALWGAWNYRKDED